MKYLFPAGTGLCLLLSILVCGTYSPAAGENDEESVRQGEYIVNHVAMCVQCHTPRDQSGELERLQLLQGAPIPVQSPWPGRQWAVRAPHIAGLPGFTREAAVQLLMTGKRPSGESPKPPMPPFRLSRADAEAVVAYLMSLH